MCSGCIVSRVRSRERVLVLCGQCPALSPSAVSRSLSTGRIYPLLVTLLGRFSNPSPRARSKPVLGRGSLQSFMGVSKGETNLTGSSTLY